MTMIRTVQEPESLTPWGSEVCCFCFKTTKMWNEEKDVPVCNDCAPEHDFEDLPTKKEWLASVDERDEAAKKKAQRK